MNILIAYELPSPSHQLFNYVLAEALVERGYNVTMLGPFADRGNVSDKYHPLVVEGFEDILPDREEFNIQHSISKLSPLQHVRIIPLFNVFICNHSYHTNGLKTLLNYPQDFKFDLIIVDLTASPCFSPLIQRFNYPPTIGITAFLLPSFLSHKFGNSVHPSYLPAYYSHFTENMTFLQRVMNYLYVRLDLWGKEVVEKRSLEVMARKVFGEDVDSMDVLQSHISLLLCNLEPSVEYSQPMTPNIIPVGGLHAREPKNLPKSLQTIMDNAKEGVVVFSLGTNIRSDNLQLEVKEKLINAFAKINYTVLWKFETQLEDIPKNVIIQNWLPQNDILGHPNTKLFITHGGILSIFETFYHGVPIIGMPFFFDQRLNVNSLVEKGVAIKIDLYNNEFTSKELVDAINEIMTNPIYGEHFAEYSRRMKDQPQTPLQRAVFWVEYAIRHNGAHFLNPKGRWMSDFVLHSIDVLLFLLILIILIMLIIFMMVRRCVLYFRWKLVKKQKYN